MIVPNPELQAFFSGFIKDIGFPADSIELRSIPSDGSQRLFWRISLDQHDVSFIGMENPPRNDYSKRENLAFLMIGRHLFENGLPIPEIHRVDLGYWEPIFEEVPSNLEKGEILSLREIVSRRVFHPDETDVMLIERYAPEKPLRTVTGNGAEFKSVSWKAEIPDEAGKKPVKFRMRNDHFNILLGRDLCLQSYPMSQYCPQLFFPA